MAMDDILGNITKALKNVFKDETDDVIEKVGKDIIENALFTISMIFAERFNGVFKKYIAI